MTNIQTILDTTPEHLRPSDHELLKVLAEDTPLPGPVGFPVYCYEIGEYGWMVRTDGGRKGASKGPDELGAWREDKVAGMKGAGFSDEFVALMRHAWDSDVHFLSLDRDGDPVPGLPLFDSVTGEMYDDGSGEEPPSPAP